MSRSAEIGCARAWMKDDSGSSFVFHPSEYAALKAAWQAGYAFFQGADIYGDELVVRLAVVVAIGRGTPEGSAAWDADRKADALVG